MQIPKDIAEKMERFSKAQDEANKLYEELETWFSENTDANDVYITDFGIAEKPEGEYQGDDEWCDQTMHGEDTGCGIYYHKIAGDTKFAYYGYGF